MAILDKVKKQIRSRMNILNLWQGSNRDRLTLFAIVLSIWVLIKAFEEFLPQKLLDYLPSNVPLSLFGLIVVFVIIHAVYIFIAQFHRRRNPQPLDESFRPSVDIFISAHNEEAVIASTIEMLQSYQYKGPLAIYLIDDRSTDKTFDLMSTYADNIYLTASQSYTKGGTLADLLGSATRAVSKAIGQEARNPITVIRRHQDAFPGKAAALNDALEISKSAVICVLDADARIDDGFLDSIVAYLSDPLTGAVQAQKVISNPEKNFLTLCQYHEYAMDTYLQMGRDSIRGSAELRGNGELIKRETLELIGGWNPDTLTDDLDLSTCLHVNGWDVRFSPENKVYEEGVPTIDGFIKQRRRWAEGSLRRYLNYFLQLMSPGNLTLNQIFDTSVFLIQFLFPLGILLDLAYECIRYVNHKPMQISFLMLVAFMSTLVTYVSMFNGLRIYKKQKFFEAAWNAFLGNNYLLSTWFYFILFAYHKVLFSRTVGTWTRTSKGQ